MEYHHISITTNQENNHYSKILFPLFQNKILTDLFSSKGASILGQVVASAIIYASVANVGFYHYRNVNSCLRSIILYLSEKTLVPCQSWNLLVGVLVKTLTKKRSYGNRHVIGGINEVLSMSSSLKMKRSDDNSMHNGHEIIGLSFQGLDACIS